MKYSMVTFGCRVNQADSFVIEAELRAAGGVAVAPHEADVVLVNSCSVTASADQGTRQTIRRIARDNPNARVIVTGCYATRRPDEVSTLPGVVRVVPNDRKESLAAAVARELAPATAERFGSGDGPCGATLEPGVAGRTALTLRVQTGCDERCSYCIIPRTRGTGRSRPLPGVLHDMRLAVRAGYKEIVITGVHLGSYGRDLHDGTTLESLVAALAAWPDEVLFRISSLEPMDCSDPIVDLVASSPRLAPHFHLPLQHGSDDILRAMERPYTSAFYRGLVDRIRSRMPHAAIGTDLIVGFPGESASHFERSAELLASLPLTHVHVFPYSDRPGTVASAMTNKVHGVDVRARGTELRDIGRRLTHRFQRSQVGTVRPSLTVDDGTHVVTDNYLKLPIDQARTRNEWVQVRVCGEPGALAGEVNDARSL
jgi:threonylcarbamoyladenosine tRNA methylthiotransferase MtaB